MKNLLKSPVTRDEIVAILRGRRTDLLPASGDPTWAAVAANPHVQRLIAPLCALAREEAAVPLPALTVEMYADFAKTGNRLRFEKVYFERRRKLARAAVAVLLGSDADRVAVQSSLLAKVTDVFEEVSWALPAHVDNDTGIDPMRIDLFGAETANTMGELVSLFGAILSGDLKSRIITRVHVTISRNYVDNYGGFWWTTITNNWNAVCHQGVLGAALALESDTETLADMLMHARTYLPNFLAGFGPDGGCTEGPGYWGYGFGWFALLNEQLEFATNSRLSLIEGDDHIREIALYAVRSTFSNGYTINFADGGPRGRQNPHVLAYLGARLGEPALMADAMENYRLLEEGGLDAAGQRTDVFYLSYLLKDFPADLVADFPETSRDYYFGDLQVITSRRTDAHGNLWELAAKAGNNDEHHNHNDCGSYILNVNGEPIATEIGAPEYVREFFGPTRYEFLAARTLGHSLPIVNGVEQAAGAASKATVLKHILGENAVQFTVDLTKCYPEPKLVKLVRSIDLDLGTGKLFVSDTFEYTEPLPFETAVATNQPVERVASGAVIKSGAVSVRVTPLIETAIALESHGYNDHKDGASQTITRIVLRPTEPAQAGVVSYSMTV